MWPAVFWLAAAVVLVVHIAWLRVLLHRFSRVHARPVRDAELCSLHRRLCVQMGIRRPVRLLEATGLAGPNAFGIFRPTVVLPSTFSEEFEPVEQQAMMVHELGHLASRDPAWQLSADVVAAVVWWHPLVWWSRRQLRAASEEAADEASLLVPQGPDALASCLVALARQMTDDRHQRLGWLPVKGAGFRSGLGRRVERLLNPDKRCWRDPSRASFWFASTALPIAMLVVAISSAAWGRPEANLEHGERTVSLFQASGRR